MFIAFISNLFLVNVFHDFIGWQIGFLHLVIIVLFAIVVPNVIVIASNFIEIGEIGAIQ